MTNVIKKWCLFLMAMFMLPLTTYADTVEIDGIYYNLITKANLAEVTKNPNKYSGNIVIPESIEYDGVLYLVTSIEDFAFQGNSDIISLSMSNSIKTIGRYAFSGCSSLKSLILSESLVEIEDYTFWNCYSLETVIIPKSVIKIGWAAFCDCTNLKYVTMYDGLEEIGDSAFHNSSVSETIIPQTVTRIGEQAFSVCKDLTSIVIPNSVTSIGSCAFGYCKKLKTITLPDNITSLSDGIFTYCTSLTSITIPNSVKSIYNNAFEGCNSLKDIYMCEDLEYIGSSVFSECTNLTTITIPDKVKCINYRAFADCSSLTSISLGKSINSIGQEAFSGCKGITDVYCYAVQVPSTDKDVFYNSYIEYAILHVPSKLVSLYEEKDPWKEFMSIVKIQIPEHTLLYLVDNEVYKSYSIEEGETLIPEKTPTKEGYTFSGWSEIPETMPAMDVTVYGTFTVNKYKLTYMVDGEEYKSFEIEYGSSITPEAEPTKEGYTFSGWSEIPETMPAHDVEITGSFTENVKSSHDLAINWNETFVDNLGYVATLGQPFDSPKLSNPHGLSPIEWTSSNPNVATVDANGVLTLLSVGQTQIKATFAGNNEYEAGMAEYSLVVIDSSYMMDNNGNVTIIGGDQTGDVTIDATVIINGQTYQVSAIAEDAFRDNQTITSLTIPAGITTIGNNAFSGCINLIVINIGKDVVSIGSRAFANVGNSKARTRGEEASLLVNCYAESVPYASSDAFENSPIETGKLLVNDNLVNTYKSTLPWSQFGKIYGFNDPSGIRSVNIDSEDAWIFDIQGNRIDNVRKGVNIIRTKDGKTKKVVVKKEI